MCNRCQAREYVQPVPSAGICATGANPGNMCNRCRAREYVQPVPSPGICATGAERGNMCNRCQGNMCNRCQAWEDVQPVPSAGKCATGAKRGKMAWLVSVITLLSQLQTEAEWYHQALYLFIQFFIALSFLHAFLIAFDKERTPPLTD